MCKCFPQSNIVYRSYNIAIIQAPTHDLFCSSWGHDLIIFDSPILFSLFRLASHSLSLSLSLSLGFLLSPVYSSLFSLRCNQTKKLMHTLTFLFSFVIYNYIKHQVLTCYALPDSYRNENNNRKSASGYHLFLVYDIVSSLN